MEITLQYFDGCPNWRLAEDRLRIALGDAEAEQAITRQRIDTPEEAEAGQFRGSPTILVDGRDPFAEAGAPVGLSCRIYRTEAGSEGAPSVRQLAAVLRP